MRVLKITALMIALGSISARADQTSIFVNVVTGSDGNAGTASCPVRTTRRAVALVGKRGPWAVRVDDGKGLVLFVGGTVRPTDAHLRDLISIFSGYGLADPSLPDRPSDPPTSGCESVPVS